MEDRDDIIVAYALGALTGDEQAEAERLLERSPEAREALRLHQAMLADLALLTPARKAPPMAADAFRARLAAESATPAIAPAPIPTKAARSTRSFPIRRLALSAAMFLLAFGLIALIGQLTRSPIDTILSDQAAQTFDFNPQGQVGGKVTLVAVPGKSQVVLVAELPDLPPDMQYQLWLNKDGVRTSGGVFSPAPNGPQRVLVTIPEVGSAYRMGITIERAGGVEKPTMSAIFVGNLPRLG